MLCFYSYKVGRHENEQEDRLYFGMCATDC